MVVNMWTCSREQVVNMPAQVVFLEEVVACTVLDCQGSIMNHKWINKGNPDFEDIPSPVESGQEKQFPVRLMNVNNYTIIPNAECDN